jgi:polysaccharide chain length determinant protein (PEP-CTERM system associated)
LLPGQKYTPEDVVTILRRRWWLILPPLAIGLALGVFVFRNIPERYRSETLIMVVPQRVPDEYVKSTVSAPIESRLSSISDQILSRSRLERIVNDLDLYKKERADGALMEDIVRRMRKDITVQVEGKDGFRVNYVSKDPRTAQTVTERLASLFIDENLRDRENLAQNTNEFLESQLEDARRRLVEHEKKLEAYRERYAGQLPTQLPGNLQAIQNAQLQLQALDESANRARERRLLLERQLADAQLPLASPAPATSNAASDSAAQLTTAQQLELAQTRLSAFKLRYTADHPDVKALERTIRELQAKLQEEAKNPAAPRPVTVSTEEAARQRRIRDLQAEIEVIDHQLAANTAEATNLKATMGQYQSRVDALPERESELVELTRDYTTLQQTYASLLEKHEESKLAANLERRQIGETFRVLDAAVLPHRPYNQLIRLGAIAGGAGAGLFLGLAIVGFLEYRDSSFKLEEQVVRLLGLPVLALIPQMEGDLERRVRRRRNALLGLATIVLALVSAAAMLAWGGPA